MSICSPNIYLDFDWSVLDDLHGSDHFPIKIEEIESTNEDHHSRWNLNKANWENFMELCNEKLNPEMFKTADDIQAFTDTLIHVAEKCIPKSSTRSKRNRPWFNKDVKNSINKRKSALRKFNRQPTKENLIHAKQMRAKARKTIKTAKRTFWQQYVSKLNSRTPAKKIWDMIRKITGKNKNNKHVHIKSNGNICSTTKDISNALGENFQKNSSSANYSETFQNIKQEREKEHLNFTSLNHEKYNVPFRTSELLDALHKSHDTAAGPDDIHYQILKHLPDNALKTLLNILNDIWITGKFPKDWSKATIIPIPKPNKDHTEATNYRPIALTSCLCKTMERMINDRLVWFLESNQLITKYQAGFRKNNCTNDHLIRLESFIRDAFIKKEHVVAVFFDLEKAYDTTWKHGIMKDLHKLGLKGRLPLFIQNFLSDRTFMELCNDKLNPEMFKTADDIQAFTDTLIHVAEKCIPKSSTRSKRNRPWFNKDVKNSINKRKSALRKFNRQPTKENLIHAKQMRAKARKTIKTAKRTSWQQYVSKLNSRTPAKKIWDMIRKITGKNKNNKHVHIKSNGNICSTTKDISNALGENFQKNSSSANYSETFQNIKQEQEKEHLNFTSLNHERYNVPFTASELSDALNKSHDTAAGPDDIHYQILKHLPDNALKTLLNILNDIWITGKFPKDWSKATIIPIPKPNKDHTEATNYRPIALTSCLCKTMERMINDRLVWFLESNQLITKYQAGFRKNNCTNDHLIRLESFIRDAFVKKEHVVAVFFDLEKAYDTTWKHGIMKDLHKLGLKGRLPLFIQNFLSDRTFNVRIGNTLSDIFKQEQGVPQGSILSPTLFGIKINDIVKCVKDLDCSLFVDDFGIFIRSKNMETIEFKLQRCLNNIEDWATENGFKFSKTKTQCVHFCQIRQLHLDPHLTIYGSPIPVVSEAKFLGLLFDNKLSFIPHIKALKAKCLKALDILKVLSSSDWGGNRTVLLNLYRSLIRSKLDYGSIVYGSARKSYLKSLDTIHHQGLRLALGAFRTSPVESLYAESNEPSLYIRREKLSLQYVTKLAANPRNSAHDCVFNPKYERFYNNKPTAIKPLGLRIQPLLEEANINIKNVQHISFPSKEPWTLNPPKIILDLHKNKKNRSRVAYF